MASLSGKVNPSTQVMGPCAPASPGVVVNGPKNQLTMSAAIQSLVGALLLALILWFGHKTEKTSEDVIRLSEQVKVLKEDVNEINTRMESFVIASLNQGQAITTLQSDAKRLEDWMDEQWPRLRELKEKIEDNARAHGNDVDWRRN